MRRWVYDRSLVDDLARVFQTFRYQRCVYERDLSLLDDLLLALADEISEHDPTFNRERFTQLAHRFRGRSPFRDLTDEE